MRRLARLVLTVTVTASCTGVLDGPRDGPPQTVRVEGPPPGEAPAAPRPFPGEDAVGRPTKTPGGVTTDAGAAPAPEARVPVAGVRRLTRAELLAAASALLGLDAGALAAALGADARQSGFTRNGDQRIGAEQAAALWDAAEALAAQAAREQLEELAPCSSDDETCAGRFIERFGARAFRRDLGDDEVRGLLEVFSAGRRGGGYRDGVALVVQAVLQSPSFLYVTELGSERDPGVLTGEELATSLAFFLTGAPPDEALRERGRSGGLQAGEARAAAARALLATPAGRRQVQQLVLEWLGADEVDTAPRDERLFPGWEAVAPDVLAESRAVIDAALFDGPGTLEALLSTPATDVTPALARWYGLTAPGPQQQPPWRRGLLLAGAFPAANALPDGTAPVRRGALVRRKLLCQELPVPSGEGTDLVVPPPDPALTTRQRFAAHTASASCASCHALLDPIGFAFETFDAVGRYRTQENGLPIDASGELVSAGDADGPFSDAAGLVARLAGSGAVKTCFERHLVRFALGRASEEDERAFVDFVAQRPSGREGRVLELLVDWARSDAFARRRSP